MRFRAFDCPPLTLPSSPHVATPPPPAPRSPATALPALPFLPLLGGAGLLWGPSYEGAPLLRLLNGLVLLAMGALLLPALVWARAPPGLTAAALAAHGAGLLVVECLLASLDQVLVRGWARIREGGGCRVPRLPRPGS